VSATKQLSHYIDGQWVAGSPASDSLNPSNTGDVVAQVPGGDKNTVNAAVSAAKAAFPAWA
jgi:aldehyde dehydrogenase (NAD+)